jgi:tRNA threonylcarbamoyladenosine biosynthesis protein TsaB
LAGEIRVFAPTVVAGNALAAFAADWPAGGEQLLPDTRATAAAIAQLAAREFVQGRAIAASQARPLYVRDRVAQTIEDRARARQAEGTVG